MIRDSGCKPGLVLNPATGLESVKHVVEQLDMLLLMSVNPGFGGQQFLPSVLKKVRAARVLLDRENPDCRLEIDGGIKLDNIGDAAQAGADTFVAGSAIFGSGDYTATIQALREQLASIV